MNPGYNTPADPSTNAENRRLMRKLIVGAVVMFGFAFSMVPIYRSICSATDAYSITHPDEAIERFARNTQVDAARTVTVEFDSNVQGNWRLRPEQRSVDVHPGELVTVEFSLSNDNASPVTGQAIPSYAPRVAGLYFRKLECFCFRQQTLAAHQTRKFPVVFVVDPGLPRNVSSIILSYTFFDVAGPTPTAASDTGAAAAQLSSTATRGG